MHLSKGHIFALIVFFSLNSVKSDLRECGEFHKKEHFKLLPYQNELEQLFDAVSENDTQRIDNIFKLLENASIDDVTRPESLWDENPIKFVVS